MRFSNPIFIGLMLTASSWAAACPSLSGHYERTGRGPKLTLEQQDCASLVARYDYGFGKLTRSLVLDGQLRYRYGSEDYAFYESAQWDANQILLTSLTKWRDGIEQKTRGKLSLRADGALIEETYYLSQAGQEIGREEDVYLPAHP